MSSLTPQLFAALAGAPTQNDRLLVLHTPLGRNVLLAERVVIDERIGPDAAGESPAGFRIVVDALAADAHIELKQLTGQPALLELLTSASRVLLRPFHGQITRAALVGSDGGLARYRLVIEPWLSFLAHRQDAWVFQQRSVVQIVEEVFADYAGQGKLVPRWRWELADPSVYAERSLSVQYQESDLAFVTRLLREEGLFYWFEHEGRAQEASLGVHTLVIADHNAAFRPGLQPLVRFAESSAVQPEDSITRWTHRAAVHTASLDLASLDHRAMSMRPQSQSADPAACGVEGAVPVAELTLGDVPGAYAFEDNDQGARLALNQMQALDALRERVQAEATVRTSAPGTTFTLAGHPQHDGLDDTRDRFVVLAARHTVRNNLRADTKADVQRLSAAIAAANGGKSAAAGSVPPNLGDEPMYQCHLETQRAAVPVRVAARSERHHLPDPRVHLRPTVEGVQTAIVVGLDGAPLHTDRDQRIKVQFHWQRGSNGSHRLSAQGGASSSDNAPASDASGTWVRVSHGVAGDNWGAAFTPRIGQEVLVHFNAGDIDRPVVIGGVYNGRGSVDAQGNQVAGGAAKVTGNAAAWFAGGKRQGELEGHAHPAVLAGHKSQELSASQGGSGGYNQLVFDDSAGMSRVELSSTSASSRLQLGHLLNQSDNQRLQARGHGLDVSTGAWGAVRAGSGVLISAHGKPGSQTASRSLDSREPQAQLDNAQQIVHTLAESGQQHHAKGETEPDVIGAKPDDAAKQLPNERAMHAASDSLGATDQRSASDEEQSDTAIGGGAGTVTAWTRPDLVIAAPGGIGAFTAGSVVASAGNSATLVAGQDLQWLAQANFAASVKGGLAFYTYGKASDPNKPNQETGIRFHAATGNVSSQSLSGATRLTADKAVNVASTGGMLRITAPNSILLTAAGAAIDLQAGSITLKGPGMIQFKASAKVWTGPGSASQSLELKSADLKDCRWLKQ